MLPSRKKNNKHRRGKRADCTNHFGSTPAASGRLPDQSAKARGFCWLAGQRRRSHRPPPPPDHRRGRGVANRPQSSQVVKTNRISRLEASCQKTNNEKDASARSALAMMALTYSSAGRYRSNAEPLRHREEAHTLGWRKFEFQGQPGRHRC